MEVQPYSEKSFAVYGDTKPWAGSLESIGGKFNGNLRDGPGWIFSKSRELELLSFVEQANQGSITPAPTKFSSNTGIKKMQYSTPFQKSIPELTKPLNPYQQHTPMSASDAMLKLERAKAKSVLPSSSTSLKFPNIFQAADDHFYQISVYTLPLPVINQKISVSYDSFTAIYSISDIKTSHPVDSMKLSLESTNDEDSEIFPDELDSYVICGSWKLDPLKFSYPLDSYKLIFD